MTSKSFKIVNNNYQGNSNIDFGANSRSNLALKVSKEALLTGLRHLISVCLKATGFGEYWAVEILVNSVL